MKLYREGKNEIRIHLTSEDLENFEITLDDFDYDSKNGKRVIWELFDKAREETGFDAKGEKVYIQLYPKAKGGCELFVTKIEPEEEMECFSFAGFDPFYEALSFLETPTEDMTLYRLKNSSFYYVTLPCYKVPPAFYEFGEKISCPSPLYLKARCKKIENMPRSH